ncbi:Crotonase superfamily [Syntrophomonas zehnderi OL-4]|uniref:short-chain-enoyl-CoA hydratase n=1 Tax=Syntrophomonas zehnderi OL-4 TaxID=690567 RepID=A0A0E4C8S5_9FIRM|nr:enoyl-CoA hydratase/isomerase family protein [Syntrophomonas zehnderi]CFX68868.1 Crotonase superfamily [Syntrophomonas zehnderi OL-4]
MSYGKYFNYVKEDNIGIVTLCNPKGFNLVAGEPFFRELYEIQEIIAEDKTLRAIVINAEGDHYSAGVDLNFLLPATSQWIMEHLPWLQRLYGRWQEFPIPVIAAVQGICYGSATELILGCDIRIAADNARFSIPEVKFGLAPDMGGTTRLTHLVGIGQAKRLIMGCDEIDAAEALRIGLVEIVVPKDELNSRAMKMAQKMAGLPPAAMRFAKKGINLANESSVAASLLFEEVQSTYCCGTEDQKEGIRAFFEKRTPEFHNK